MSSRISRLRSELKARSLDGVIVHRAAHIRYLCGFSGSAGLLLVTQKKAAFFTDFRYKEQMAEELVSGVKGYIDREPYERMLAEKLIESGMTIGFQESAVSMSTYDDIRKRLKKVKLERTGSMVADLTAIKSDEEIESIRKAADIASKVYRQVLEIVKPGMKESDLAAEISYRGKKLGSEGDAFDIIVASGPRGALPHGRASAKKIRKGELVTLDFGFIYNGFNSDMTRTFAVGNPSAEAREIYEIVLRSQKKGVAAARAGVSAKDVDDACRNEIAAAGYGEEFGHSTGHGLGIDVHEMPTLSSRGGEQILKPGMVVTIEPGIYLPERCGVRIEDDVVITKEGCTVLTKAPKELIIV